MICPVTRRDTSSLIQAFSPPSSKAAHMEGTSSFCFFWCFLVHTLYTLVNIFSSGHLLLPLCLCDLSILCSVFCLVFTYIHYVHTQSLSALLVSLGERTGSLLGLISLSISDFSIGSVQSHHISVFCTSSLTLYLEGHIYLKRRRSSDQPDTSGLQHLMLQTTHYFRLRWLC